MNSEKLLKLIEEHISYSNIAFRSKERVYGYEWIIKTGDQSLLLHYDDDSYLANPSFLKLESSDIQKNWQYSNNKKIWNARVQLCFRAIKIYETHFEVSMYNAPDVWIPVSYHGISKLTIF